MWTSRPTGPFSRANLARVSDDCARFDAPLMGDGADPDTGGGGSQPPVDPRDDGGAADQGDPAPEPEPEEALEDLISADDEDDAARSRPAEERIKALAAKSRKQKRQLAKFAGLQKRLEGVDLDDLVTKARNYENLDREIRSNPRLRARLYGDDEPPARERPAKDEPVAFDEKSLPFDPDESPTNRYFANLAKSNHELTQHVKELLARQTAFEGRDTARGEATERAEWKAGIDAAAEKIQDARFRVAFKDSMAAAFQERKRHGKSLQFLITHYLGEDAGMAPAQAARTAAAAAPTRGTPSRAATQERIATHNSSLSRNVATGGTAAPARAARETLDDVRKRLTGSRR